MVRMRLMRVGARNYPYYRIVVSDSKEPRDGRFIEILGHYIPTRHPEEYHIDRQRAIYWLTVGAQPTETVIRLLSKSNIWQEFASQKKKQTPSSTN